MIWSVVHMVSWAPILDQTNLEIITTSHTNSVISRHISGHMEHTDHGLPSATIFIFSLLLIFVSIQSSRNSTTLHSLITPYKPAGLRRSGFLPFCFFSRLVSMLEWLLYRGMERLHTLLSHACVFALSLHLHLLDLREYFIMHCGVRSHFSARIIMQHDLNNIANIAKLTHHRQQFYRRTIQQVIVCYRYFHILLKVSWTFDNILLDIRKYCNPEYLFHLVRTY